jgi:hypothetical protein
MGWISGVIILIFVILYVFYVVSSYYLSKGNKEIPPKATINFDNCKETIENLDFDENFMLSGSNRNSIENAKKKSNTKVNLISVDRNSLTPNMNLNNR